MFCKKGVLRNFAKLLRTTFFQRIPPVTASERVNAHEAGPLCSVTAGKENISGET